MTFASLSLKVAVATFVLSTVPTALSAQGAPISSNVPPSEEVRLMVATLQSTTADQNTKFVALHRLSVIGTKEAIPAMAALLTDDKMAHYARLALEPMPDPAAGAALRDAMGKVTGRLLVGIVNSIGVRRDAAATAALAGLLANNDAEIAAAAAAALGRIGSIEAAKKLQISLHTARGQLQITFADASLTCCDMLIAGGNRAEAASIYEKLYGSEFPGYIRAAAMCGAIISGQDDSIPLLVQQLKGSDDALLAGAWSAARQLPGSKATKALAAELGTLPDGKEVLLIHVLGDRGDKAALPAVLAAAKSRSGAARVAALQTLPRVDDNGACLPLLLDTIIEGKEAAEVGAAIASLSQIGGTGTDTQILTTLPKVAPALRAKLIGVLAARRAESACGELLKLAAGSDVDTRKAAFRALAVVSTPADLPELIRLLTTEQDDAVKMPAFHAVYAVSMKIEPPAKRADPLLTALRAASDTAVKYSLLGPLGVLIRATGGSPQALETVILAMDDSDAQVRDLALRCLADWPDSGPALQLLEIFIRDPDPSRRELALSGGARMAATIASSRDATKLDYVAWFTAANRSVRSTAEKLIIVSSLRSVKQFEGLQMLKPYLDDPAVQTEAELALLEIATELAASPHGAVVKAVLEKITESTKDADVRSRASKIAIGIPAKN